MVIRMYFSGIDVAKKQHEACVIDDQGTIVLTMPVPNTQPKAARKRVGGASMLLPSALKQLATAVLLPDRTGILSPRD